MEKEIKYTVITDNGGGPNNIYHDVTGEVYTFPPRYKSILSEGTKVVYHRAAIKSGMEKIPNSLSDKSHYFGIAEIGEVTLTDDGNFRAQILNYFPFKYPVNIHRPNGTYYEGNSFFQQGVRKIDKTIYEEIKSASLIVPVIENAVNKKRGHRSLTNLSIGIMSDPLIYNNREYRVVTGKKGYYLQSYDHIFYELKLVPNFYDWNHGVLKIGKSANNNFVVSHNSGIIGFLTPITNGMKFQDKQSNMIVNINM